MFIQTVKRGFKQMLYLQKHLNSDTCNKSEKILNVTNVHLQSSLKQIKD